MNRAKMIPLRELNSVVRKQRIVNLSVEGLVMAASVAMAIYYLSIGDPKGRIMSCVGTFVAFFMPMVIEWITRHRFTFAQHIILELYMFFTMFLGSVLYLHHSFAPFDEISHTLFGYFSCVVIFYGFIYSKAIDRQKAFSYAIVLFFISMGVAAIWEITEFCVDFFMGENSLGFPPEQVTEYIKKQGMVGIAANLMALRYTSVIDTVTDMMFHVIGSAVFVGQFLLSHYTRRNLLIKGMESEVLDNRMNKTAKTLRDELKEKDIMTEQFTGE